MDEHRPDPDQLLTHAQEEDAQQRRGRLRIFLGYAAGVGKTYAMLEAARGRHADSVDVVAGYIETHGRAETDALLEGLEVIPPQQVNYRGVTLREMDLDAVLAHQPQLVLVDELAHTNAPGLRHPKRFQDVEELLEAGIDVYATLNVQHLASLNDVVAQITGVTVRETLPDRLLDEAVIRLIDLPVEELRQRLDEGKVYVPEQAERAVRRFFRPGNLNALRELALRRAARRVDEQMRAYMQTHAIAGPWPASDRLLVCVGPSPLSERLVRTTSRLASELDAEWVALYVETPASERSAPQNRDRVAQTLRLSEELGGQAVTLPGNSVAETVATYAQTHNITKIIAGKPLRARWLEWLRPSPVDQIIRSSPGIDVYVISAPATPGQAPAAASGEARWLNWHDAGWGLIPIVLATLVGLTIRTVVEPTNLVMLYLLAVVVAAVGAGRRSAILASLGSVIAFDFFLVPPYHTFVVADAEYVLTFVGLLVVGIVISTLTARAHEQAQAALRREAQTNALYELSRELTVAIDQERVAAAVLRQIERIFGVPAMLGVPGDDDAIELVGPNVPQLDSEERGVVSWVYHHGKPAGQGTETLSGTTIYCLPLMSGARVLGVLGLRFADAADALTIEQQRLLDSFARQTALAVDRVQLSAEAGQAQLLRETEKFQTTLLNSISHDLRTPLATITGALSSLSDDAAVLDETAHNSLIQTAAEGADRLNWLVGNLLSITRLESGALKVVKEAGDVEDAIGTALEQVAHRLDGHPVEVDVPDGLPLTPMDFGLVVQALVNLIDNALKYSPAGSPLEIRVRLLETEVAIDVMDRGPGIPAEDLLRIFDKFYRIPHRGTDNGTGLGLSIVRGIVELHNGRVWAINRAGGGAVLRMTLPVNRREAPVTLALA